MTRISLVQRLSENYLLMASDIEHQPLGSPGSAIQYSSFLQWLTSYLSDRQLICINKHKSRSFTISCGVPQGSVLGPQLFLIYMLPLGQIIKLSFSGLPDKALNRLQMLQNSAARALTSAHITPILHQLH